MKRNSAPAATIVLCSAFAGFAAADNLDRQREQVAAYFKSAEEPAARDAHWTQPGIFKVGVLDDGSPRDGYAEYVCAVLEERGFKGRKVWVQVIDIAKLVRDGRWEKLGQSHCR